MEQVKRQDTGPSRGAVCGRELDAMIAEQIMGFVIVDNSPLTPPWFINNPTWVKVTSQATREEHLKRYSTDLNACFEAQAKCIKRFGVRAYVKALIHVLHVDDADGSCGWAYSLPTATAEQRCRAMLRAAQTAGGVQPLADSAGVVCDQTRIIEGVHYPLTPCQHCGLGHCKKNTHVAETILAEDDERIHEGMTRFLDAIQPGMPDAPPLAEPKGETE